MKNKNNTNGFVFVETMVTIVILATALLSLYTLFNSVLVREKRRIYYDDPIYIYRANYLSDVFIDIARKSSQQQQEIDENYETYMSLGDLLTYYEGTTKKEKYMTSFTCDNDIFKLGEGTDIEKRNACLEFFKKNQIYRIYLTKYDLSFVDTCSKNPGNAISNGCMVYKNLNSQVKQYLKTLSYVPGQEGYYLVFEFNDDGNNGVCNDLTDDDSHNKERTKDKCMHQFANVKFGASNNVLDYETM